MQFERRTEASAQVRLLRPDSVQALHESGRARRAQQVEQGGAVSDSLLDDQARPGESRAALAHAAGLVHIPHEARADAYQTLPEPPGADPHAGWCGGRRLKTSGYPIRAHYGWGSVSTFHTRSPSSLAAAASAASADTKTVFDSSVRGEK